MLFDGGGGSAFRNIGEFFLYRPDALIRSATYYDTGKRLVREYEYEFRTNNLGLVQTGNIEAARPSVLVLGDSFTEGQGAEPWFEKLAPFLLEKNYQAINGGLLGTGFRQWVLLHEYLKRRNFAIEKLIVVFVSDDYSRPTWNFSSQVLDCLSNYLNCIGDEDFYGMPPDSQRDAYLAKLRNYRISAPASEWRLRDLLPATALAYRQARRLAAGARGWLSARFHPHSERRVMAGDSFDAGQVRYLADAYGKDVIFVHIPDKGELRDGPEAIGVAARAAIREAGAALFDGFSRCGLAMPDFHVNDGHPNAAGYAKIAACVREAASEIM